jgi:hypothetical protein
MRAQQIDAGREDVALSGQDDRLGACIAQLAKASSANSVSMVLALPCVMVTTAIWP